MAKKAKGAPAETSREAIRMFLVPCSCRTTFAVSEEFDRHGTQWSRFLICPGCGKRHDPRNRLLQMAYRREGFWGVEEC